jgi:hypothetical protein
MLGRFGVAVGGIARTRSEGAGSRGRRGLAETANQTDYSVEACGLRGASLSGLLRSRSLSSGRVLAGMVDPRQDVVCDVDAGVDGHGRDDPAGRGCSCGDEHRNYEAVAEGLSDAGMDTGRHRQHRDGEKPGEACDGIVDARSGSRLVSRHGGEDGRGQRGDGDRQPDAEDNDGRQYRIQI